MILHPFSSHVIKHPSSPFTREDEKVDRKLESFLSGILGEDVVNEKLSSVIHGQDHDIVDVENEKMLDSSLPVEEDDVKEKL